MPPAGFQPTISKSERLQAHVFDRAAAGIGQEKYYSSIIANFLTGLR